LVEEVVWGEVGDRKSAFIDLNCYLSQREAKGNDRRRNIKEMERGLLSED